MPDNIEKEATIPDLAQAPRFKRERERERNEIPVTVEVLSYICSRTTSKINMMIGLDLVHLLQKCTANSSQNVAHCCPFVVMGM